MADIYVADIAYLAESCTHSRAQGTSTGRSGPRWAQSAASDPGRYAVDQRDAALGEGVPLVTATAHLRDDSDSRFERQFQILLTGLAAFEP